MAGKKPFVVNKVFGDYTCVGCGELGRMVEIIPTEADDEWFICSKCLQWLKSKLMGF